MTERTSRPAGLEFVEHVQVIPDEPIELIAFNRLNRFDPGGIPFDRGAGNQGDDLPGAVVAQQHLPVVVGLETQVVVALAQWILCKMPAADPIGVAAAAGLELPSGIVVDRQPEGIETRVFGPAGSLQQQGAFPEVIADLHQLQVRIKGVPAPPAGMDVAQHRHAEHLIAEQMLAAVTGKGLNHGMPDRRCCSSVLAQKTSCCIV